MYLKGVCRYGLYRARPQDSIDCHALTVPPIRNQNPHDAAPLSSSSLSFKLDPASRSQNKQSAHE